MDFDEEQIAPDYQESGTTSYTYNGDGTMATGERRKLRKSGPLLAS